MVKPFVYLTRRIPESALKIIAAACDYKMWSEADIVIPADILRQEVKTVQGIFTLLTEKIDGDLMDQAPDLKVIGNMAVGYDNINVSEATKRGILVTNTPGVLTETTADLTFALLMATARRLVESMDYICQDRWKTWSPMLLTGQDVYGSTLGIIGMGAIGAAVARRAKGFGMKVLYHNRRRREDEKELGVTFVDKEALLKEADFVCLLAPLTPETRYMIGEEELNLMKPSAILINSARGPLVDTEALYIALKENRIWAAGLDVFETEPVDSNHKLLSLDNVVALPHIGSASIRTRTTMAELAAENLVAALTGKRPPNPVNPEVLNRQ